MPHDRGARVLDRPTENPPGIDLPSLDISSDLETPPRVPKNAGSYLIVVQNPSLDGTLGILMAEGTMPNNNSRTFTNTYLIMADEHYTVIDYLKYPLAKIKQQEGDPLLHVLELQDFGDYNVASILSHEVSPIALGEFQRYQSDLKEGRLDGIVNSMVKLIGEKGTFPVVDGALDLPADYASTRLVY